MVKTFTLPHADNPEIWESETPRNLRKCSGLCRDRFTFNLYFLLFNFFQLQFVIFTFLSVCAVCIAGNLQHLVWTTFDLRYFDNEILQHFCCYHYH